MFKRILILLPILLAACSGASAPTESSLETIRLPMGFIPNIQYAPYYVAVENGYFAEAGYEIEFDYSFETNGVNLVGINEVPFAVVSGEQVLAARAQGAPVVYVMAWYQDYPVAIVTKTERGITTPQDLVGKQVGLPGLFGANYIGLRAVLSANGIAETDLTLNAIDFTQVENLATDRQDAVVGYISNEPIQLRAQGYDVNVMAVRDYVHLASNGIITNETMIANQPERVRDFIRALQRGLVDTLANPEEAFEISTKYVENLAEADRATQMEVLDVSLEFWQAETIGYSDPEAWENMQDVMLEMGLYDEAQDLDAAYTNEFIE